MATQPFFVPTKEIDLINELNEELIDDIIGQTVDIYKIRVDETNVNMYGETVDGGAKTFEEGFRVNCLIMFNEPDVLTDEFGPDAKVVHIDVDPAEIGKVLQTDVPIVGDLKMTLEHLLPLIERRERVAWIDQLNHWRDEHRSLDIPESPDSVLPQEVVRAIYEVSGGKARVIADVGQNQMWAAQHFRWRHPRQFITSGGAGSRTCYKPKWKPHVLRLTSSLISDAGAKCRQ